MIIEETIQVEEKDKGFTLVELLIVIVILGILATIVVFAVRGITDRGKTSACAADSKTLEVAIEAYFADNGGTTVTEADLVTTELLRQQSANYNLGDPAGKTLVADPLGSCV